MQYKLICDYQENFESYTQNGQINDHQDRETFQSILRSIRNQGYDCEIFEGVPALLDAINKKLTYKDTIFLNLSDGMSQRYSRIQIPVLCEILGVPYSGGNAFTAALTSNKYYTKMAIERIGIKTPFSLLVTKNIFPDKYSLKMLNYPTIIKPNSEGSSLGITEHSICYTEDEMLSKLTNMLLQFEEVLVEEFIPGYDITDFVIGNKHSYLINEPLIAMKHGKIIDNYMVMSYLDYLRRDNWYKSPKGCLSDKCIKQIKNASVTISELLETYDLARIDYRVTENEEIYFLETNTVPAIHRKSQAGAVCKCLNLTFDDFVGCWINAATNRLFPKTT